MIDIDFFKKVNDTYGHDMGDRILEHVAQIIKKNVPHNSHVYRWGGEGFLVVLKTSDMAYCAEVCETIRRICEESVYKQAPLEVAVTVSMGAAAGIKHQTIGECIKKADESLYAAKNNGRNRLVIAPGQS